MSDIRIIKPRICFDYHYNDSLITVVKDTVVNVWLETIYNSEYTIFIDTQGLASVKVSDYQYEVTADLEGYHKIYFTVVSKLGNIILESNTLIINSLDVVYGELDFSNPNNSGIINLII